MNSTANSNQANNGTVSIDASALAIAVQTLTISLLLLAFLTVFSNGLFLVTFYKDPLKCLRTPTAIFMAGLSSSNFLTGLIVEPAYVGIFLSAMHSGASFGSKSMRVFLRFMEVFSFVTITSSFLIMLALGIVQYLLIKHPRIYNKSVSAKSAVIGIIFIFIYSILFALLPEMTGINKGLLSFIDLLIHNLLLTVALVTLYLVVYCQFRKLTERHRNADLQENSEEHGASIEPTESEKQRLQAENDFVYGTIILTTVLIVTVWPFCICVIIAMVYGFTLATYLAWIISLIILLLKFALDPFVFAWRLRKYRKSLELVWQRMCQCGKPSLPPASYHRSEPEITSPSSEHDHCGVEVTVVDGTGPV
ncbi:melanopsin-like [Montipora capricornis]|uniref:melanopsin-like n=1 Tax=Montipora capricornis TaxID=246305 RepID=UPI0035F1F76C